ncbi:MAG: class II fumarate hydratase [Spirochaetota bacterium]
MDESYRVEVDSMGEVHIPRHAYWGAQTQRAVENFPISRIRFPHSFIRAMGMVKLAAARANVRLGLLDKRLGEAIERASGEVMEGKFNEHFVVDIFQTGSGTSTNMNANEVIANRANELLGTGIGKKFPVHPNDHVNMGQSSNDVIPTCMHIAALQGIEGDLLPSMRALAKELLEKEREFDSVVKIGRTHCQDATPIRLGQEFSGYRSMVEHGIRRVESLRESLQELAIGGTAVGTGINTHPQFAVLVIEEINRITGLNFREAENHFEAQGSKDGIVQASSILKCVAVSLMKIANDVRFLSSGPRCGIGELILPEVQPGSSMMPGKVNPVIAESLCQICAQVIGNDAVIAISGMLGHLELNVMMPVMTHNLLQSIEILSRGAENFAARCIRGIKADELHIKEMVDKSLALCTALSPYIGYEAASELAKEAYKKGKTIIELAKEKGVLSQEKLDELLDPRRMTGKEKK